MNWMERFKWKDLPKRPGFPETKGALDPMPPGPYFLIHQLAEGEFLREPEKFPIEPDVKDFKMQFAHATYILLPNGKPFKVAFWYDTSD